MTKYELERDTKVYVSGQWAKVADTYYKDSGEPVFSVIFDGKTQPEGRFQRHDLKTKEEYAEFS